jgi:hypothetical protein
VNRLKAANKRTFLKNLLAPAALLACSGAVAGEVTVNFQTMADGAWGESAWSTLSLLGDFGVDVGIEGTYPGDNSVYAYLDRGTAGLGTCRTLNGTGNSKLNTKTASGTNLCNPSSDDNVNIYNGLGEGLMFNFNQELTVKKIWFNNNHDPDYGMGGDTVVIDGSNHTFGALRDHAALGWLFDFGGVGKQFNVGDMLDIGYYTGSELRGEEFYISAVLFDDTPREPDLPVPVPSTLALLGLGLAGLAGRARRK